MSEMTSEEMGNIKKLQEAYAALRSELGKVIVGQSQVMEELLIAMFCRGHCLLVGVPGLAKTLLISTLAKSQMAAVQFAFMIMLPSVLLSGFVFPRAQMPLPIYAIGFALPVTYFLEILRGIILRAAEFRDLLPQVVGLAMCCVVLLTLSIGRFRKTLT